MEQLDLRQTRQVWGGADDKELGAGTLILVTATGIAKAGSLTITAAPVIGLGAMAAGGGYLVGDWIEQKTGVGATVGDWVGSTWIGSNLFNW